MKKFLYKLLLPIVKVYWFIFRPKTFGVKCLIKSNSNVLMIRNTYGKQYWTFPGGGIKKNETAESGAKREVQEEVGISLNEISKIGQYKSDGYYKKDTVYCFYSKVETLFFQYR